MSPLFNWPVWPMQNVNESERKTVDSKLSGDVNCSCYSRWGTFTKANQQILDIR